MGRTRGSALLIAVLLLGWVWAGSANGDQVYRWVEKNGSVHFSDSYYDVPPEYQGQVSKTENFGDRLTISSSR